MSEKQVEVELMKSLVKIKEDYYAHIPSLGLPNDSKVLEIVFEEIYKAERALL